MPKLAVEMEFTREGRVTDEYVDALIPYTGELERYAQQQRDRAEKAEADNAVLREALEMVRAKAIHHDPEFTGQRTNGSMPRWNGVVQKIDAALLPTSEPTNKENEA
jgi:hypothetical protein